MSGHSHWSTIQRQKGTADAKRGQTFTKIASLITIAAKVGGGGDPDSNPRLRMVLETARSANMPKENIERAIDRGLGKLPGQSLEEVTYEGFGPSRVAFCIEGITDNKMRTLQEIRNIFERSGGSLAGTGAVSYMFDKKGEIKVRTKGSSVEEETLELIDLGAEDVEDYQEDGVQMYLVYTESSQLSIVSNKIAQNGFEIAGSEIILKPNINETISDPEAARKIMELGEKLEEHSDIQKVYTNFEVTEEALKSL